MARPIKMARRSSSRRRRQLEFVFRSWGGRRAGAGRKPKGKRAGVPHRPRPALAARHPVHVTFKLQSGLPSLRSRRAFRAVAGAVGAGAERFGVRLVHFSAQRDHVHLIVEAPNSVALSRSMKGLAVRLARALNRALRRHGTVAADRFHARALKTPLEVRRALRYVLQNGPRHAAERGDSLAVGCLDGCSSAPWFDGWRDARRALVVPRWMATNNGPPTACPRSWLLRIGWRRHGLLSIDELPAD